MAIKETSLNKGQIRKLNALRKSIGIKLGEDAFGKWLKEQAKAKAKAKAERKAQRQSAKRKGKGKGKGKRKDKGRGKA